jgi:cardiolipin synthase
MLGLSLVTVIHLLIALPLCGHVLLRKEHETAAFGWIALILLSPFVGSALYGAFGINRVERKARKFRGPYDASRRKFGQAGLPVVEGRVDARIVRIAESVNDLPFLPGNLITPLINGDEAFPAMLQAIAAAKTFIILSTYIFDSDSVGQKFVTALIDAARRGVAVKVLVDGVGLLYSAHAVDRDLRAGGVETARFIPRELRFLRVFNLRNHRKMIVVDAQVGFIGGMNIRQGHVLAIARRHKIQDIHFQVSGPVLDQFTGLFEEDWQFATDRDINLPRWVDSSHPGEVEARLVPDGPDHHSETLQWLFLGALSTAQRSIRIMTPYFIPNPTLISALAVAAMRGVEVEVLIPERTNIPFLGWGMAANFETLMTHGVKIYLSPPPFDHSKLMLVDGSWSLVGSTNWDQRSLRLNFEANLESLNAALGAQLQGYFSAKKAKARQVSLEAVKAAPLYIKLRNNFVRLFGPYL